MFIHYILIVLKKSEKMQYENSGFLCLFSERKENKNIRTSKSQSHKLVFSVGTYLNRKARFRPTHNK